ncbi:zinc ribbon domain-containing protein [Chloroflexus aggregans]|uniref:Zinc-ribbon domain-containing protein n=1 Tax=Chloroflexus aggregans (strain MD-66 / DSM 9485) TaxID=326427 RepID=B8GA66_CHLAD|nr:zinc ribbon domain-containing protein [Chloroflexus aggregans]ACL24581.1 conserved hypothetical protein [Chloroflexus aggregans DSM 9485]
MSESQQPKVCSNCGHPLAPTDRFCPNCGTRVPEKAAPPTVVIPPDQPPAAPPTVVLPPNQPPAAPPTTVLPPSRPSTAPPTGLPPTQPSAIPTPTPPVVPPVQSAGTPPDPFMPTPTYHPPVSQQPPFQIPASPNVATTKPNRGIAWLLVGGIGCLLLIFVGACIFALVAFSTIATDTTSVSTTPVAGSSPPTGGSGTGGSVVEGRILFQDKFDNPASSALLTNEDNDVRYAYEQGRYVIEVKQPELLVWSLIDGTYRNVTIEASYIMPGNMPNVAAGLIFHYQDEDNFYLFSVSNDGYYALELLQNNQWTTLIDWTKHQAINPERNRIRVELRNDEIVLYVNDKQIDKTRDPTFTDGNVALAVTSFDKGGGTVEFEEITISQR